MITKILDAGGHGDYTTLDNLLSTFLATPLTDDVTIKMRTDTSREYGSSDNASHGILFNGSSGVASNGYTIRFTTHENYRSVPAVLLGSFINYCEDDGDMIFDHIKIRVLNDNRIFGMQNDSSVQYKNCVIYINGYLNTIIDQFGTTPSKFSIFNNCSIFASNNGSIDMGTLSIKENIKSHNSLFCGYNTYGDGEVSFNFYGSGNTNYNNAIYNYAMGSGGVTAGFNIDGGDATMVGSMENINPNLHDEVIQARGDKTDTMAARNEKITSLSTCLINNAYESLAETDDINGSLRF